MIKDKDFGYKALKKELKKLNKKPFVKTGVLTGVKNKLYEDGQQVVDVAILNELGGVASNGAKIPARPFLRVPFDKNRNKYVKIIHRNFNRILEGKTTIKPFLDKLGLVSETDVKKRLRSGPWTPNAPMTIKLKKSSRPLIDTGQLINSIVSKTVMNGVEK